MAARLFCYWHRILRHFDSGMSRNQNFDFWNFFSPSLFFLFATVIDLLLGLLAVKKLLRKCYRDGQFLLWSSYVQWQEILLWVLHSTFWAFLCNVPLGQSLWSGYYWKDLFLLQQLCIDDANFAQKLVTSEVEERPRLVTASYGWQRSQWVK